MDVAPAARRRPGTTIFAGGLVAVALSLLLFTASAVAGAVEGHPFGHVGLLGVPLVLMIGGLTAVMAGGIQRAMS